MIIGPKLSGLNPSDTRSDLHETIRQLLMLVGGPEGLANLIHADLKECVAGSANRIKIELTILQLLREFGAEGDLPDDEPALLALERQLRARDDDGT